MLLHSDRFPLPSSKSSRARASTARAGRRGPELFSARSFEWFLERERCFADRGARTFGLILLEFEDVGGADGFVESVLDELRSTDVIGRLDRNRIGMLLPDADADAVIGADGRIGGLARALELRFTAKSYAYPDAQTVSRERRRTWKRAEPGSERTDIEVPELVRARCRCEDREPADLWALLSPPAPLWKRAFDIALAGLLLLALLPLFALVALAIRLESEGPVFFRQQRVGRGGRLFTFYKFRSMYADAEARRDELAEKNEQEGPIFKMRRDPRVTRIGRWLRRASIDELPQLWNVLRGDFSLVGPRPPTPDEVVGYEPWQRRRLSIPGGLTCRWQVSGRSEIGFEDWMRLDMRYVARRGLLEDLVLLARTIPAVLSGRGAY
jgi:lipopolysaccharide/colanic/teichoic acid biosynthesis glycosyltransferase